MSRDRKFVFVEVPKTGTSAVAKRLLEVDPTLKRDVVYLPGGTEQVCSTHITASEMRLALGHEAEEYCFIAFLRDPREQMISKYFFYKNGRAKTKIYEGSATFGRIVRHASTRLLPLHIWILVYPYKNSAHFVQDGQGRLCVDILGDFNHLEPHFRDIFSGFGYSRDDLTLELTNSTSYEQPQGWLFRWLSGFSLWLHAPDDQKLVRESLSARASNYEKAD